MSKDLNYTLSLKDLFSKQMRGAADSTSRMDSAMSKIGGTIAGAFAVGSVVSFGKAVIESLKNYQYFHASLKTMLHGNTDAANALEGQLVNLAKTTPFELVEVQKATKQLLAYGFKAGEVVQTMRTLGDVSSGVGAPLEDVAYLYGTLKTSGRVMLKDLQQFANRGIPIYDVLRNRLHKTTEEINEMASAGTLGFKDIETGFKDMTAEGGQFFNLMADQSKTVGGQISNMSDAWEQIKVNIGKSQTGILAMTIGFMSNMANAINDKLTTSNFIDEAYKAGGAKQYDALTTMYSTIPGLRDMTSLAGTSTEMKEFAIHMEGLIDMSGQGITRLKQSLDYLKLNQEKTKASYKSGEMSADDFMRREALIGAALKGIKGNQAILNSKGAVSNATEKEKLASLGAKGSGAQNSGVNITAARPQSLTINITKLVENLNLTSQTLKEGTSKIREEISKVFLEMVNDANLITR
jgi:phage tail tape-measure protein